MNRKKNNRVRIGMLTLGLILPGLAAGPVVFSAEEVSSPGAVPVPNLFAEQFFLSPDQGHESQITEVQTLAVVEAPDPARASRYGVITDFGPHTVRTQQLYGFQSPQDLQTFFKQAEIASFEGAEIRRLEIPVGPDKKKIFYWVGHKAFQTLEEAQAQIALIKALVESQGGNFEEMVKQAASAHPVPETQAPVEISPAQFQKEEELMLRFLDHLDIGTELFGPFQGQGAGEPILWQSFGETTWRLTNLESRGFDSQVAFWTNRLVFKGLRAPFNTIDPYVEATASLESNGVDFKDTLILGAGLEWRLFNRSPWINNFRPWSLPIFDFVRNYRVYTVYQNRKNLKDEIEGSPNHELLAGIGIFYEFGIDLPEPGEGPPTVKADYIRRWIWGEYFGNYYYSRTGFSAEDNPATFIFNSSLTLGFFTPPIAVPANPFLDDLTFMPYMRLEHVNSTQFSFPFQNRYFVAAGLRWMPFRNYRYKDNEWLYKLKLFGEYVGVGRVQNAKQDGEAPNVIDYDLRFGVNFSSRRY